MEVLWDTEVRDNHLVTVFRNKNIETAAAEEPWAYSTNFKIQHNGFVSPLFLLKVKSVSCGEKDGTQLSPFFL